MACRKRLRCPRDILRDDPAGECILSGINWSPVGVVRLFISGESWYERTEQILGLKEGAPPPAEGACGGGHQEGGHGGHHSMAFFRLDTRASFALSREGLAQAPEIGPILADRAKSLSRAPEKEDVLILAHGPGDDAENQRWIAAMKSRPSYGEVYQTFNGFVASTKGQAFATL